MKKILSMTLALLGVTAASSALAQPGYGYRYGGAAGSDFGPYFGLAAGELLYNEEGLPEMSPTILQLHVGQQFNPWLGIEGRIGTNVSGGRADGYHVDSQAIYAGYIRGTWPINPLFSAYGLLGLGGAKWHRNYPADSSNDIAVSYGVGAQFNVGGNAALTLEWARLTNGNNVGFDYTADELTFGVTWRL